MPYKEGHVLQFRLEAFNVLNHPNWQMPTLNVLAAGFGTVNATSTQMRQVQLGLKYSF